ncbi:NADPH:adrenodoxin oxidoreductase, mitochondrial-like isoform X2 [Ipomoea triloba]|uniref:NADPH:adrenodoxin oxidoreductase, mitochondrial-like isoform X2 n=1 Tax=Ipomoea triloba TaxID=35885 RepID=UPI00125E952D|nr:NADPH:adrenodoxin oxidoreductase, mitochondrial-like isoform X2 [Ipomoea triloba]
MALTRMLRCLSRSFTTVSSSSPRVCIVGSGPAGFYTADKILKAQEEAQVDIIDRLPTPFGLVRSGVAPDHPETKVVLCYGAESDRALGIPGEDLTGIYSAREFVWWYNGHPDCRNLAPDLKNTDTAVVVGQGNVALDVARVLLRSTFELAKTDISSHALAALEESCIRKVFVVGRRGPVQASFTAKELREILGIKNLYIHIEEADLHKTPADEEVLKNNRINRRIHELLSKAAISTAPYPTPGQRELHFVFFRKPERFLESDARSGHVAGVKFERTIIREDVGSGKQIAVGTGQFDDLECRLVLKSIGYKSVCVEGLPFDPQNGIVPNIRGRVLSDSTGDLTEVEKGLYVCGWLKRGPTGIIATNLYCAEETEVLTVCNRLKTPDVHVIRGRLPAFLKISRKEFYHPHLARQSRGGRASFDYWTVGTLQSSHSRAGRRSMLKRKGEGF